MHRRGGAAYVGLMSVQIYIRLRDLRPERSRAASFLLAQQNCFGKKETGERAHEGTEGTAPLWEFYNSIASRERREDAQYGEDGTPARYLALGYTRQITRNAEDNVKNER